VNNLSKKLHDLEKNVLPEQPLKETSRWGFDNGDKELNKAERQLYDMAKNIGERVEAEDLTADQIEIMLKSHRFVTFRILDLFETWAKGIICYNDPLMWHIFSLRFYWFLNEVSEQISQQYQEQQIWDSPDFMDLCPGEQDKKLKPLYDSWKRDLFTKESFSRFIEQHMRAPAELNSAEERELELLEQEEKEEEAKDIQRLAEKCVSCIEKERCDWYAENSKMPKKIGKNKAGKESMGKDHNETSQNAPRNEVVKNE
jgi:hypothetical protein